MFIHVSSWLTSLLLKTEHWLLVGPLVFHVSWKVVSLPALRFYSLMIVVIHGYYLNSRAPYYLSVSLYQITFCDNTHKHNYYFCMLVNISPPSLTFHYYYMFTLLRNTNKMNCININRPKGEIVVFICLKSRMSS